jgi:hypothetical protein
MRRRAQVLAGLLGLLLVVLLLTTNLPAARVIGALVICLLLPGLGWARKMHFSDLGDTLALAIVLSICTTVAVGTTMAISDTWSLRWGLAALAGVALAGFVPAVLIADRTGAAVRLRIAAVRLRMTGVADDGGAWAEWYRETQQQAKIRRARAATASEASAVWVDWYADVERRAEEAKAREAAAKQAAVEAWITWYQQTHLLTKRSDRRS